MEYVSSDVYLQPGSLFFCESKKRLKTVLGSCVAVTLWHQEKKIGAMCHIMLPEKPRKAKATLDLRYAMDAVRYLSKKVHELGTNSKEYQVRLYGGGNMFPTITNKRSNVGLRNIKVTKQLLTQVGFNLTYECVGGSCYRNITMDGNSGDVTLVESAVEES